MTRRRAIGAAFTYAAFFGLLSGLLEAAARSLLPWAPPWRIRLGAYLMWMPAVANLILFSAVAVVLAAVLWWKPRLATPRSLTFVFVGLATINVLALVSPPLHMVAALLLAAGVAVGAARLAGRYSERVDRLAGFGAVSLAAAIAAVAIGVEVNRALAARPDADRPALSQQSPNILLLVLDNVRSLNLTPYGYFRDTSPTLQRLAERGVLFERAYSTSSWSLPSHASLMTGRWVHELEADWVVPLDDRYPTLAEALSQHGYRTAGFVSNGAYTQRESGVSRGFTYYEDYPLSIRQVLLSSKLGARATSFWQNNVGPLQGPFSNIYHRRSAADLHERLLGWLDRDDARPFFAFVNYFDAHVDYYAPADIQLDAAPPPAQGDQPTLTLPFTPEAQDVEYDRAIAGMDRDIGRLLSELEARGLLENTLIIVTSDHGEEFEEHDVFGHGNTLYSPALLVPMILSYPDRFPAGLRLSQPVSIRAIPATVLAAAGVEQHGLPGCTLARHWTPGASAAPDTLFTMLRQGINTPPEFPVSRGDMISVITDRWHLIVNGDGVVELYDVLNDPWEQRDLAADPAHAATVEDLRSAAQRAPASGLCTQDS